MGFDHAYFDQDYFNNEAFSDNLKLNDTKKSYINRQITASFLLNEIIQKLPSKLFTEALRLSDNYSRTWNSKKTYTDTIKLSDGSNFSQSGTLLESLRLTDATSKTWSLNRNYTETIRLSDGRLYNLSRKLADTLRLSATPSNDTQRKLQDNLRLSDITLKGINHAIQDYLTLSDGDVTDIIIKLLTDQITLLDSHNRDIIRTLANSLTLSDGDVTEIIIKLCSENLTVSNTYCLDSYSEPDFNPVYIPISNGKTYKAFGQAFTNHNTSLLVSCKFFISKVSTPTGSVYARLYNMTGSYGTTGKPTGTAIATSDPIDVSTLTSGWYTFDFSGSNRITLTPNYYCIEIEFFGGDKNKYLNIGMNDSPGRHDGNASLFGVTWQAFSEAFPGSDADVLFCVAGYNGPFFDISRPIPDQLLLNALTNRSLETYKYDPLTLDDKYNRAWGITRLYLDSITVSDGGEYNISKLLSDVIRLNDSFSKRWGSNKTYTDSLCLSSTALKDISLGALLEGLNLSDIKTKYINHLTTEILRLDDSYIQCSLSQNLMLFADGVTPEMLFADEVIPDLLFSENVIPEMLEASR